MNPRWSAVLVLALVGCAEPPPVETPDSGVETPDAGIEEPDAGLEDAGAVFDAGDGVLVTTTSGPIVGGTNDAGITSFVGVPFAEPPVGALRWKAPVPVTAWATPRNARTFGKPCPQSNENSGQTQDWSEDCLTLNVWTPDVSPGARRPMMVFIHGGGFRNGAASGALYQGGALSLRGGVVLASLEYRLGALGFLAHPALSAETTTMTSGNYGLMDQQLALKWLHDNAEQFGADPDNITVFGESAGSISTCLHLVAPGSNGLFQRAIGQSGSCLLTTSPLRGGPRSAEALGTTWAAAVGCGATDVATCLRALTPAQILAVSTVPAGADFGSGLSTPIVDGVVLPEAPADAIAAGRLNSVSEFLGGVNRDEATLFTIGRSIDTQAALEAALRPFVPDHVDDVLAMYPPNTPAYPSFKATYDAFAGDALFACPTRQQLLGLASAGVTTYAYRFEKLTAAGQVSGLGVFHGSELPFIFGTVTQGGPAAQTLSVAMTERWSTFARTGAPDVLWPAFSAANDEYMRIDDTWSVEQNLRTTQCDAIAGWLMNP